MVSQELQWSIELPRKSFFKRWAGLWLPVKKTQSPFFHRIDLGGWNKVPEAGELSFGGCCIPPRNETMRGIYVLFNGQRIDGEWGLTREGLPPSLGGEGGTGPYGYRFNLPLPSKNTALNFYAVLDSNPEKIFSNRVVKICRIRGFRSYLYSLLKKWRRTVIRRTLASLPHSPSKGRIVLVGHILNHTGAPILLLHLALKLKSRGHEIVCVSLGLGNSLKKEFRRAGIPVLVEPLLKQPDTDLHREFDGFDVVIANTVASVGAVEGFCRAGMQVIWWIQDGYCGVQSLKRQSYHQNAYNMACEVVFPSPSTARLYDSVGERSKTIIVNGIADPLTLTGPKPSLPPNRSGRIFSIIGAVCERKGQDLLIEAVRQLPKETASETIFQIAGALNDPGYYNYCRTRASGLNNIRWLPECSHESALHIMASSDVLIVASRDEALPVVIQEAMALGKAIISTRAGGVSDYLVDGHDCLLVPVNDAQALGGAISRCFLEEGLISRMGQEARRSFERLHQLDGMADRFELLIEAARKKPPVKQAL